MDPLDVCTPDGIGWFPQPPRSPHQLEFELLELRQGHPFDHQTISQTQHIVVGQATF